MILPDVNVLVHAFRSETPLHAVSRGWLDAVVLGDARFGVSPLVLSAVVRVVTNPRAFAQPSTLDDVFGYCDELMALPHCQIVVPGDRHWEIFSRLCTETQTRGPRVSDAWYAALAIEWGCDWISFDRDFARFPGLSWRLPSID